MKSSTGTSILQRIVWLIFAIAIAILFVRLWFDVTNAAPSGQLMIQTYDWSSSLLAPANQVRQAIGLSTNAWGLNLQALFAIVLYVGAGWMISAILGLFRRP